MKKWIILVLILVTLVGCNKKESEPVTPVTDIESLQSFTLEELTQYNGKDGNKAYIAVEGLVYDVTDHKEWKNGEHNGYLAGVDLTKPLLEESPHGRKVLEECPLVGKIIE